MMFLGSASRTAVARRATITTVSSRPAAPLVGLVALLTLVTLELMRASGPFIDHAFAEAQLAGAVGAGLVTYLATGLVVGLLLTVTTRRAVRALLLGVGLLVLLRLSAQALTGSPRLYVGLTAVALGLAVLVLAVSVLAGRPGGGAAVAGAVGLGAAGGVGLQLALTTWDAFWRPGLLGWVVTVTVVGLLVALASAVARDPGSDPVLVARRTWALGPALGLLLLILANPAFAASQGGAPLWLAGPVTGAGLLVGAWWVGRGGSFPPPLLVAALPAAVGILMWAGGRLPYDGTLVLAALVAAQVLALFALSSAIRADTVTDDRLRLRTAGTGLAVGLTAILPVMLYQVAYEVPLGFPNEWVVVAGSALLGAAAVGGVARRGPTLLPLAASAVAGLLLVVGAVVTVVGALTAQQARPAGGSQGLVVMSWNIHYAVDSTGALDPESVARAIDRYDPDVLLLNEISSGWVLGGGLDVGTWLSQRLDRQIAFAPAADRQFGSAVLSGWELRDVEVLPLPQGEGSQERSALSARVRTRDGELHVVSVQLQNKAANATTRVLQVDALLAELGGTRSVLVAGDLNANPGTDAVQRLSGAGFRSAVDEVGDPAALTYPAHDPEQRLDWVWGRGLRFAEADVLEDVTTADHLPIVVTLR